MTAKDDAIKVTDSLLETNVVGEEFNERWNEW